MTRRLALLLVFLAAGILAATEWLAHPLVVAGPSMRPALAAGDHVFVDVWTYRFRAPRPGEIVVGREPRGGARVVKRVAPRPVEVNGFWLLGDNAPASEDSRVWGAVAEASISGRVVWRYWPLSRFGPVPAASSAPR